MNKFLKENITKIILFFIILNPFLDLLTSIFINILNLEFNFVILIKGLFLTIIIYYMFFICKSKYKKISNIYIISILIYSIIYLYLQIYFKDITVLFYEGKNLFRVIFFPITLVSCINIYLENDLNINYKTFSKILLIYLLLIFIPLITNTGFNSYSYSKIGTVGWFNSTNEIGGILSILYPFLLLYIVKFKNVFLNIIFLIFSFIIYFSIGSKVPVLSLIIIYSLYIIKYLYSLIKKKLYHKLSLLLTLIVLSLISIFIFIPKTSFYKNIIIHLDYLEIKEFSDLLNISNIDHFVFSSRIKFLEETRINYYNSPLSLKLFGIGYIENYGTDYLNLKTIEMDYYDIFYRNGIIGFILILLPLFISLIYILKNLKFSENIFFIFISLILSLLLALFSGHIFVSPSVSIYVIMIIIMCLTYQGVLV